MPENLANNSRILLFGREVIDIKVVTPGGGGTGSLPSAGPANLLAAQIAAADSRLARVYAFAYEGGYFELSRPALFLVHGPGTPIGDTVELSGLTATARDFAPDVLVWAYDKSDLSVRLDVETGTLEQVLLETELNAGNVQFSGQAARLNFSGQAARLRYAGQAARLRGNSSSSDD